MAISTIYYGFNKIAVAHTREVLKCIETRCRSGNTVWLDNSTHLLNEWIHSRPIWRLIPILLFPFNAAKVNQKALKWYCAYQHTSSQINQFWMADKPASGNSTCKTNLCKIFEQKPKIFPMKSLGNIGLNNEMLSFFLAIDTCQFHWCISLSEENCERKS